MAGLKKKLYRGLARMFADKPVTVIKIVALRLNHVAG